MTAYYRVGTLKLATLSLCTLGFYGIYWFYRQWEAEQQAHDEAFSPPLRAIFSQVTAYFLFVRIRNTLRADGDAPKISPGLFAVVYAVLIMAWRLPDSASLIGLAWFLPILPVQQAINDNVRKHDPDASLNETWEWWAFLLACIGGTILFFGVIGTLFPELAE